MINIGAKLIISALNNFLSDKLNLVIYTKVVITIDTRSNVSTDSIAVEFTKTQKVGDAESLSFIYLSTQI
jgi:hypothetical protein